LELCAVCQTCLDEPEPPGIGIMLFHRACRPACRFCSRRYRLDEGGWDFRGQTVWSDAHGYLTGLESAACPDCTELGGRRDYGLGS
jgi:hypothetical protein